MPQEELGYVELEWTCKNCGTRNPGTRKTCANCGAAMGVQDKFDLPVAPELVKDKPTLAQAANAPDVTCPYCGTRNAADAKTCKQCGGDLTGAEARFKGGVLGAFDTSPQAQVKCPNCGTLNPPNALQCSNCGAALKRPAPAPQPAPAAAPPRQPLNPVLIGAAVVALLVVCGAAAYFLFGRTSDATGTVAAVNWQRTIAVMAQVPVRDAAWKDQLPSDGQVIGCELKPRRFSDAAEPNSTKVCGTPYVLDQGNGTGKVVQDCQYQVSEQYCSYTRLQWSVVDTIVTRGTDLSPAWPSLALASGQREGNRAEEYHVVFEANGQRYTYTVPTANELSRYQIGSRWRLEINGLGSIVGTEPAS